MSFSPAAWIFDHDGTLVDSFALVLNGTRDCLKHFGGPDVSADDVRANMLRATRERMAYHLSCSPQDDIMDQVIVDFYERLRAADPAESLVYPHWPEVLKALQHKTKLGVLSNNEGPVIRKILSHHDCDAYFSLIFGEDDVPKPKPTGEGLLFMAQQWGLEPKDMVMVGDSAADFRAAEAAGCMSIGVTWGAHDGDEIREMSWTHVIDSPLEILPLLDKG